MNERSEKNLEGVHPDLVAVVRAAELLLAAEDLGFIVTEGLRTPERQAQLVKDGKSWTLNSRHLTGHAVDLAVTVGGKVTWEWPFYVKLATAMKQSAGVLGVPIEWGGDWRTPRRDGPHFQLPWATHPKA